MFLFPNFYFFIYQQKSLQFYNSSTTIYTLENKTSVSLAAVSQLIKISLCVKEKVFHLTVKHFKLDKKVVKIMLSMINYKFSTNNSITSNQHTLKLYKSVNFK